MKYENREKAKVICGKIEALEKELAKFEEQRKVVKVFLDFGGKMMDLTITDPDIMATLVETAYEEMTTRLVNLNEELDEL